MKEAAVKKCNAEWTVSYLSRQGLLCEAESPQGLFHSAYKMSEVMRVRGYVYANNKNIAFHFPLEGFGEGRKKPLMFFCLALGAFNSHSTLLMEPESTTQRVIRPFGVFTLTLWPSFVQYHNYQEMLH